jgi:hypothetical protein
MANAPTDDLRDAPRDYLLRADEQAVSRALPRQIADALNLEPRQTLELLVDATFCGDVVLHWELFCPACQFYAE